MQPTQADYWNGEAGDVWAAEADTLDPRLETFGQAAMRALALRSGERVLDVGCGAGATTRELKAAVGAQGTVVGIDVSHQLIAAARARGGNVTYVQADAASHDLGTTFDAVYSRFGVMFFEQPTAAFANLRRLAPRGRLAFVCWRRLEENSAFTRPLEIARHLLPEVPAPPPEAPGPFAFAEKGTIERILSSSGWRSIAVVPFDTMYELGSSPASATELALKLGPLGRALRERPEASAEVRALVLEQFTAEARGGVVAYPAAAWVVTARA